MMRADAIAAGLLYYCTGKSCKNGHIADRYTSSGECTSCERERRERSTQERQQRAADWYAINRAAKLIQSARWYAGNNDAAKKTRRKWYADNKPRARAIGSKRRARLMNATPDWDAELTDLVAIEAADLCVKREAATGFPWHVDHMIPLQARKASGLHTWANLQVIPGVLNQQKFNRMMFTEPFEWLREVG